LVMGTCVLVIAYDESLVTLQNFRLGVSFSD
jgi:hypothetical protein